MAAKKDKQAIEFLRLISCVRNSTSRPPRLRFRSQFIECTTRSGCSFKKESAESTTNFDGNCRRHGGVECHFPLTNVARTRAQKCRMSPRAISLKSVDHHRPQQIRGSCSPAIIVTTRSPPTSDFSTTIRGWSSTMWPMMAASLPKG